MRSRRTGRDARERALDYVAVIGSGGRLIGTVRGPSVRGLIYDVDQKYPHLPGRRATIRAAYTSDGTFHGEGHGRVMATREAHGWAVESHHDRLTEAHQYHGEPYRPHAYLQYPSARHAAELGPYKPSNPLRFAGRDGRDRRPPRRRSR